MTDAFNPTVPSIARVYDYWLGGKDHYAADRELADKLLGIYPGVAQMVRDNRQFLIRGASWAAEQGIAQFLDLGAGMPTTPNVHETVRQVVPDARVAYVDNDPVVHSHARSLLAAGTDGVSAVSGDVREAATVLADPGVSGLIDFGKPVCLILAMVLHFMSADEARDVVAGYLPALAPGSYVLISVAHGDGEVADEFVGSYAAARLYNHSVAEFTAMFGGLSLVPPGVAEATAWRPGDAEAPPIPKRGGLIIGAAGQVP